VLHLFSGRRRNQDVQMCAEWLSSQKDYVLTVLSIDIAIDAVKGDLTRRATIQLWQHHIRTGRIVGSLQAPPYETWSAVRFVALSLAEQGPRPLRSSETPWGLDGLSTREIKQVGLANQLLMAALTIYTTLLACGGFSVTEHPVDSYWVEGAPSIWKLPEVLLVGGAPCSEFVDFKQGLHGQISPKPTTLMVLRLPTLRGHISRPQCPFPAVADSGPLRGKDAQGRWRTAPAKEYPSSMCKALAMSFIDAVDLMHSGPSPAAVCDPANDQVLADLRVFFVAHDPYSVDGIMGADCALFAPRPEVTPVTR
jgi:hypothetical protein